MTYITNVKLCPHNCDGCDRRLRRGEVMLQSGPLNPYPVTIHYDVCQKERTVVLADGLRVALKEQEKGR